MKLKQGFTLVEILFVVIIAAGILAFAVPAYKRAQERGLYEADTGVLMDIGNAIQGLRMATGSAFPQDSSHAKEITSQAVSEDNSSKTVEQYLQGLSGASFDNKAVKALFLYGYLQAFKTRSDYKFYAISADSTSVCDSRCRKPENAAGEVVACMCSTSGTENGCYFGAVYLSDGTVRRITKDDSSCS